jgi:hypothetical protein
MGSAKKGNRRRSSSAERKNAKEPVAVTEMEVTDEVVKIDVETVKTPPSKKKTNSKKKETEKTKNEKDVEASSESAAPDANDDNNSNKQKKDSKEEVLDSDDESEDKDDTKSSNTKSSAAKNKDNKKTKLSRKEKQDLKEQVPQVDENGMAYSKLEIRRMVKRVKRGLVAVPSKEEQRKVEEERRQEKNKEEKEWDAMMSDDSDNDEEKSKDKAGDADATTAEEAEEKADIATDEVMGGDSDDDNKDVEMKVEESKEVSTKTEGESIESVPSRPVIVKKPVKKAVPSDYICQACKNSPACGPPHWIYDCPQKKNMPGTNTKRKRERGLNKPDEKHKLFVSGLPFHISHGGVEAFFRKALYTKEQEPSNRLEKQKLVRCKLVGFADTQECRGQAFVTFTSESMAQEALKLNGSLWPTLKKDEQKPRWLKIQPVKSRVETGKLQRQKRWQERMRTQKHDNDNSAQREEMPESTTTSSE